jgi:hypothetical protein
MDVAETLKFLEVYSKTIAPQNKYASENCWNALKLIISMRDEITELNDELKELKGKNGQVRNARIFKNK